MEMLDWLVKVHYYASLPLNSSKYHQWIVCLVSEFCFINLNLQLNIHNLLMIVCSRERGEKTKTKSF